MTALASGPPDPDGLASDALASDALASDALASDSLASDALALLPAEPADEGDEDDPALGLATVAPAPVAVATTWRSRRSRRLHRARTRRFALASAGCLAVGLIAAGWAVAAAGSASQITRGTPAAPAGLDVVIAAPVPHEVLLRGGTLRVVPLGGSPPYRVDLFVDGDWVGADREPPFAIATGRHGRADHEVKAKVTDADGTVRYSTAVPVTAGAPTPIVRARR